MKSPGKAFWRRLVGSLLVGWLVGPALDFGCQLVVSGGDFEHVHPPVFGFVAATLVVFTFWNRLARIELLGLLRVGMIGTLIGIAAGAILGLAVYPSLREAFGPRAKVLSPEDRELHWIEGMFLGVAVGGILGAITGGLSYLFRLPGDQRKVVQPQEPIVPEPAGEGRPKEPS